MFYAKNFTYDGQPSELYNLNIANLGDTSSSNDGSGAIEILERYIYGRSKPYFYGVYYNSKSTFPISIFSKDEIDAVNLSYIQNWLFAQSTYRPLAIVQPDMDSFYFNCIFTNPQVLRFGNIIYGFNADCVCDSQFAWTYPKTLTYSFSSPPSGSTITFYNNNHYQGYLYPSISFTMDLTGGSMNIVNSTDSDREFLFEDLLGGEVITINNDLNIVQSSTGLRRLSNFNKNFFRFIPGLNTLAVSGNISELEITYQFARRLG